MILLLYFMESVEFQPVWLTFTQAVSDHIVRYEWFMVW